MSLSSDHNNKALLRPALSSDNEHLAVINEENRLLIVSISTGSIVSNISFPRNIAAFVTEASILNWAPEVVLSNESHSNVSKQNPKVRIVLAGQSRLVVLEVDRPHYEAVGSTPAVIIADYSFESSSGKITLAEFVSDHCQVLTMFETNVHASILHLTKPQRDDIPLPKYQDHRGFAQPENRQAFAVLQRTKGRDQVAVFVARGGNSHPHSVFAPETLDAQALKWSPLGKPILAVWDSAAYGPNILFFTALGHPLRQLDVRPEALPIHTSLPNIPCVGILALTWTTSTARYSMLAFSVGGPQLILREQDETSMKTLRLSTFQHSSIIDGSHCQVWRQLSKMTFDNEKTMFEVPLEAASSINLIELNCDASMIATKVDAAPNTLWIWSAKQESPAYIGFFDYDIKSALWHPYLPDVLVIVTNEKEPGIYIFNIAEGCPKRILLPYSDVMSIGRWRAKWVVSPNFQRCPLLVSNSRQYYVGLINQADNEVVLESIIGKQEIEVADDESMMYTPCKPGAARSAMVNWNIGEVTGTWKV